MNTSLYTPQIETLLSAHTGIENLRKTLNVNDVVATSCDRWGDEKHGYTYWINYQSKKLKLEYDVFIDFINKTIYISKIIWDNSVDSVFLSIICGIINNSNDNINIIRLFASGDYSVNKISRLYYLCALYGFTPNEHSLSEIILSAGIHGFDYIDLEDLFHTTHGLEYWWKRGKPFNAEFFIHPMSKNIEFLLLELKMKQLLNWLEY